jgi:hypothetical protein
MKKDQAPSAAAQSLEIPRPTHEEILGIEDPNENHKLIEILVNNVAGEKKYGGDRRISAIGDVIRDTEAQFLCLQEVAFNYCVPIAEANPNYEWIFGERVGDLMLNPIGYNKERFDLIESWTIGLSDNGELKPAWGAEIPRAASFAIFYDKENSAYFLVVNFHLDNKCPEARLKGIQKIHEEIQAQRNRVRGVIICGDMNTNPTSPKVRWHRPDMRAPYQFLIENYADGWCEGNPNKANRPHTYHSFKGDDYTGDEYGTSDSDFAGYSTEDFDAVTCSTFRYKKVGIFHSDHDGFILLLRLKKAEEEKE